MRITKVMKESSTYHRLPKEMDSSSRIPGGNLADERSGPFIDATMRWNMRSKVFHSHLTQKPLDESPRTG
jgi:hypothetical protein